MSVGLMIIVTLSALMASETNGSKSKIQVPMHTFHTRVFNSVRRPKMEIEKFLEVSKIQAGSLSCLTQDHYLRAYFNWLKVIVSLSQYFLIGLLHVLCI